MISRVRRHARKRARRRLRLQRRADWLALQRDIDAWFRRQHNFIAQYQDAAIAREIDRLFTDGASQMQGVLWAL